MLEAKLWLRPVGYTSALPSLDGVKGGREESTLGAEKKRRDT